MGKLQVEVAKAVGLTCSVEFFVRVEIGDNAIIPIKRQRKAVQPGTKNKYTDPHPLRGIV